MYFINSKPSYYHLLNSIPVLIPDFDNPFPVTGTGMENCIPKFWEREWKIAIQFNFQDFIAIEKTSQKV